MQSEWPIVPVAECCELIVDCVNKTAPVVESATPFKMIRTTNVRNGFIDLSDCKFVDESTFRTWTRRAAVLDGDVVLTREAPIGEVGLVRGNRNIFLGQRLMQYRANRSLLDPRFLCYAFLSPQLQHQFGAHEGSGSVVSHIRVGDCSKFKISLPPLTVQRAIAELLGSIDERVILLRQSNGTIESIAQALFKSWFIDFDPVRAKAEGREPEGMDAATAALFPAEFEESALGLIPKGWRAGTLSDAFDINPPRSLSKGADAPYLEMANAPTSGHRPLQPVERRAFGSGCKFKNGDALLAKITPCLENGKGAYVDFLDGDEVGWGSTEFIVLRSKSSMPAYASYLLSRHEPFRQFAIQAMTGTSGRQRVELSRLVQFQLAVPPSSTIAEAANATFSALQARIAANSQKASTLSHLRDVLLPRLISGKLRMPDMLTEQEVADVL